MKYVQRSTVKTIKHLFVSAVLGLSVLTAFAGATVLPSNGPFAGGNRVVVTNVSANIGNGDITNITVGGVTATDFAAQGTNWVTFIAPAVGSAGAKDIVIQSTSESATTLSGAYTVNSAGTIYDNMPVGWSSRAGLPIGLKHFAAVTYSNAIYTLGGQDAGYQAVTNVFRFDGTSWTSVAGLPVSNYYQGADVYSGAVYSVGGYNAECIYGMTNAYRYDGTSWAEVAGLPKGGTNWGFHSQAVKSFGGYLYSMGGYYYVFGPQTNVYRYNGTLWQEVAGLPAVGMNASAAVLGANLYYMGGGLGSALTNVYRFDGATWSPAAGLPVARMNMACMQRESAIYVAGGWSDSLFATTNVYRFDGTNWQEMVGLPRAFANGAGAVLNDMMYVLGGDDAGGYATTSVYRYAQGSVGVAPTSGSVTGGYQVVISGTNLCDGTIGDVTSVSLCGVAAFVAGVSGSTQIVVTAGPAAVAGLGNVAVYSTSYGITIKSNIFTYTGPVMDVLGTNGAAIASGEAASANKGTDFGTFLFGAAPVTNTFAATNSGNQTLNITLLTTNGSPLFQCSSIPVSIAAGTASNFFIVFNPSAAGVATVSIAIANNSGVTPFVLNVKGTVNGAETNLPAPTGVSATDGTYTNMVRVTWLGVAGATSYEILRNTTPDANGATVLDDVPASQGVRGQPALRSLGEAGRSEVSDQSSRLSPQSLNHSIAESLTYTYDDYTVVRRLSYYYWVRAIGGSVVSALSYVGMGYAELGSGQTIGRSDLTIYDMVFLPVNLTNGSPAGTVSYRLANGGPDTLTAAPVRFDFYMVQSNQAVWMAYNETNVTLAVGAEQLIVLDAVARQWLRVRGDLAGQYTVQARVRHLDSMEDGHTGSNMTDAAGIVLVRASGVNSPGRSLNDYDGDGKSDGCLYQGTLGRWYMELSGDRYGADPSVGDVGMGWTPVPGDYDGDGITDVAAYNRLSGQWLVKFTSNGLLGECWLGGPEFTAAPCDFDGDAMTDPMVYREADGYVEGAASTKQYALYDAFLNVAGYQWVQGDFDGDGLADLAAYNRTTGLWAIGFSSIGYRILTGTFGGSGYLPVPADYDGDGKTDPAVYAPGTACWQVLFSRSLETQGVYTWCDAFMGTIGGIPVPADYDGDGRADPAVYHQDTGIWELFPSAQGYQLVWGLFGGPVYQPVME